MIWGLGLRTADFVVGSPDLLLSIESISTIWPRSGRFFVVRFLCDLALPIRNPRSAIGNRRAEVAKLADALDLGSSVERRASSSLALGTSLSRQKAVGRRQLGVLPTAFCFLPSALANRQLLTANRQLTRRSTFIPPFAILSFVDED